MVAVENYLPPNDDTSPKIVVYDVEHDSTISLPISLRFIRNLKGISQITSGNFLYICGSASNESISGSYLLRYDATTYGLTPLVNCIFHHYCPSLSIYHDTSLFVLGGRDNKKCEMFNLQSKKWIYLPELPEIRYGASSLIDEVGEYLYLFGGYDPTNLDITIYDEKVNNKIDQEEIDSVETEPINPVIESFSKNKNKLSKQGSEVAFTELYKVALKKKQRMSSKNFDTLKILRAEINNFIKWTEIEILNKDNLINKSFSMIVSSKSSIYILGGTYLEQIDERNFNKYYLKKSEELVELNFETFSITNKLNLPRTMSFETCRESVFINKGVFFSLEDEMISIKLESEEFRLIQSHIFK